MCRTRRQILSLSEPKTGQRNAESLFPEREYRDQRSESENNSAPDFNRRGYCADGGCETCVSQPETRVIKPHSEEKIIMNANPQFPDTPGIEKLLKASEVARILNISRSFAYLLMQSGNIPVVRVGHSVRVRPSDLRNYISENTVGETGDDLSNSIDNRDGSSKNTAEDL